MLIYLHGFRSGPQSGKVQVLSRRMSALGIGGELWCQQLPHEPKAAMTLVETAIEQARHEPTLVGSSLGGFYASSLAEKHGLRAVLINPFVPHAGFDYSHFIGEHYYIYSGERFCFSKAHLDQLLAANPTDFSQPEKLWLLAERGDEVLDCRQAEIRYRQCRQTILDGGDHSFTRWPDYLDTVLAFAGLHSEHISAPKT